MERVSLFESPTGDLHTHHGPVQLLHAVSHTVLQQVLYVNSSFSNYSALQSDLYPLTFLYYILLGFNTMDQHKVENNREAEGDESMAFKEVLLIKL